MSIFITYIQHCTGIHTLCNKIRKTNKIHKQEEQKRKTRYSDEYIASPLESTPKKSCQNL